MKNSCTALTRGVMEKDYFVKDFILLSLIQGEGGVFRLFSCTLFLKYVGYVLLLNIFCISMGCDLSYFIL